MLYLNFTKIMAKSKAEIQRDYEKRTNYAAQEKYEKENIRRIVLKLNKKTDADILDWIEKQDNIQGAIKNLIRKSK